MKSVPVVRSYSEFGKIVLVLDLSAIALPDRLASSFVKKQEFEVYLVSEAQGVPQLRKKIVGGEVAKHAIHLTERGSEALKGLRFNVTIHSSLFLLEREYAEDPKGRRTTLVARCDVEGAEELYIRLKYLYHLKLKPPPFYVTLYTLDDRVSKFGIDLATEDEFNAFARPVTDPNIIRPLAALI
jgi:hypothetical protein